MRHKGLALVTLLFTFSMTVFLSVDVQAAVKMSNKKLVVEMGTTPHP